jgi:protein-S-isoprenylcysteine O-methyltransferase Ste14
MFGRFTGHDQGRPSIDRRRIPILIVTAAVSLLFIFTASRWPESRQEVIQVFGIGMIVVCILGRTWCSLIIGGRKTYELIKSGPYSIIRNPLYLFSMIGAAGIGAQFGAVSFAIVSGTCIAVVLYRRTLHEEKRLLALHGDDYRDYLKRVPRFLPRGWSWQSADLRFAKPTAVIRSFVDACLFLLAVPFAEYVHHLQHAGRINVLALLP